MSNEKKNDGGPAFPTMDTWWAAEDGATYAGHSEGLTIRDYFAAKAMQAMWSQPDPRIHTPGEDGPFDTWQAENMLQDARVSYRLADAMLKAREE